jgi:hypothetical protein
MKKLYTTNEFVHFDRRYQLCHITGCIGSCRLWNSQSVGSLEGSSECAKSKVVRHCFDCAKWSRCDRLFVGILASLGCSRNGANLSSKQVAALPALARCAAEIVLE